MNARRRNCLQILWAGLFLLAGHNAQAVDPLHARIDQAIAAAHLGPLAASASDEEFLRRIHLDLVGRSPTIDELEQFVTSDDPAKRSSTVDALLSSDQFNEHFVDVLDILFMERRGGVRVAQQEWTDFLSVAVAQKWPFDKIVRALISADGTGQHRGASKFLIQREVEPNALTRDIGRILFGRDLQCAQCHDHPNITDYEQSEYFGIYAFVARSYLFEDPADKQKSYVGEKAIGDSEFQSVFEPDAGSSAASPNLLGGLTLDIETPISGDDAYVVPPSKADAGVPKFSRRGQLARLITHPENELFAKNVVNRFWAHMMGRGLVHPADFHHSENPPTHPGLLQVLADDFVAGGFDYRELLKQIALSQTYQRSIDFPEPSQPTLEQLESRAADLAQKLSQTEVAKIRPDLEQRLRDRRTALAEADSAIDSIIQVIAELKKSRTAMEAKIGKLNKELSANQAKANALEGAVAAAKKVSELSPDDKQLATTLTDYQQRFATAKQALDANKTALEQHKQQQSESQQQLSQQQLQLAKLQRERVGLADMVAEARGALGIFRQSQRQSAAQRDELRRQLATLDLQRDVLQKQTTLKDLADRKDQLAASGQPLRRQQSQLDEQIKPIDVTIANHRQSLTDQQQELTSKTTALDQQQQTLDGLTDAIAKAGTAADQLDDQQIQTAVDVLKEKQQSLNQSLAQQQQQLTALRTNVTSTKSLLDEQLAIKAKLLEQRDQVQAKISQHKAELDTVTTQWKSSLAAADLASQNLRQSWERRYVVRSLVPLTPEQLAGATISALELMPRFEHEAEAEWEKKNQDKKPEEIDAAQRKEQLGQLVQNRVDAVAKVYVSLFAAPGGSPQDVFSATADQALFMANDGRFQSWLAASKGTLLHRLQSVADNKQLARDLYHGILSRSATDQEQQQVAEYLQLRPEQRNESIRELAWGLLSSLEFRFNR